MGKPAYIILERSLMREQPFILTMIVVPGEVLPVDEEVVVLVQLPELAVYHIEMFVAEKVGDLIDVVLVLEES